jgi:hypothetical protein
MRNVLISLTVVEIVLVIAVLAFYLIRISASLHETARHLAKSTYGVRAVETQCSSIGPSVTKINEQLATITGALGGVATRAETIAENA